MLEIYIATALSILFLYCLQGTGFSLLGILAWKRYREIKAIRPHLDGTVDVSYDLATWEKWRGITINAAIVERSTEENRIRRPDLAEFDQALKKGFNRFDVMK